MSGSVQPSLPEVNDFKRSFTLSYGQVGLFMVKVPGANTDIPDRE